MLPVTKTANCPKTTPSEAVTFSSLSIVSFLISNDISYTYTCPLIIIEHTRRRQKRQDLFQISFRIILVYLLRSPPPQYHLVGSVGTWKLEQHHQKMSQVVDGCGFPTHILALTITRANYY